MVIFYRTIGGGDLAVPDNIEPCSYHRPRFGDLDPFSKSQEIVLNVTRLGIHSSSVLNCCTCDIHTTCKDFYCLCTYCIHSLSFNCKQDKRWSMRESFTQYLHNIYIRISAIVLGAAGSLIVWGFTLGRWLYQSMGRWRGVENLIGSCYIDMQGNAIV